ncbi:MAG: 50S ribosomal protein L25 [Pontiella sp.]
MENAKIIAKKRNLEGTSNSRRLRKTGLLPAVIYGAEQEAVSVEINAHDFEQIIHHGSESMLIEIEIEGEDNTRVLVKEIQHHPVSSDLLHVDLLRVTAGKVITVEVALELVGEAAGVKAGGILDHIMHSISVEVLPKDMVEKFEIDVSELEIGEAIHVSGLSLGSNFNVLVDEEAIVATVAAPRVEEEADADAEAATGEPEVITEKKEEE